MCSFVSYFEDITLTLTIYQVKRKRQSRQGATYSDGKLLAWYKGIYKRHPHMNYVIIQVFTSIYRKLIIHCMGQLKIEISKHPHTSPSLPLLLPSEESGFSISLKTLSALRHSNVSFLLTSAKSSIR